MLPCITYHTFIYLFFFYAAGEANSLKPSTPSVIWRLFEQDRDYYESVFSSVAISHASIEVEQEIGQGETWYKINKIRITEYHRNFKRISETIS